MAPPIVEVEDLVKTYRVPKKEPGLWGSVRSVFRRQHEVVRAVDGVTFSIERGERVAFLGPNGAGKTTTLKMLSGLLVPTGGTLAVAGHQPSRREPEFLSNITLVMGQKQQLLWDLPPSETFELNRALFDLDRVAFRRTLEELVELLELGPLLGRPVRNLSLGERMKCELAAALVHRPAVLFLDEPTIGLDVRMQVAVRQFIADWNERNGATVLLTSHYMADISALCSRVVVIAKGTIRYDGELSELVRRLAPTRRVVVTPTRAVDTEELPEPFVLQGGRVVADVPMAEVKTAVDAALRFLPVQDLAIEEPPLEDVIAQLFSEEEDGAPKRDEGAPR